LFIVREDILAFIFKTVSLLWEKVAPKLWACPDAGMGHDRHHYNYQMIWFKKQFMLQLILLF